MNANHSHLPKQKTLFLGLPSGQKNFGWGICGQYLIKELSAITPVQVLDDNIAKKSPLPGKVLQGLTNEHFYPLYEDAYGSQNYGYTFFENELSAHSIENAKRFDLVLAGSTWCRDRMIEKGITNCGVLIQGIDPDRFFPAGATSDNNRFVVFSGGKFELRKGQDLVLRAMKILQDKYPDIVLVNCWHNIWPYLIEMMRTSPHIHIDDVDTRNWTRFMNQVYTRNGLDPERIKTLEAVPNHILRNIYQQTDIGIFPNRCEGGTNLVLMEYMACGKPVIASYASGHKDVINQNNALLLKELKDINIIDKDGIQFARWKEPSVDEIVDKIEFAYHHRDQIKKIGINAGEAMKRFTWRASAMNLMRQLGIDRTSLGMQSIEG